MTYLLLRRGTLSLGLGGQQTGGSASVEDQCERRIGGLLLEHELL